MVPQDTEHQIEKPTVASAKVLLKKMGVPEKEVCIMYAAGRCPLSQCCLSIISIYIDKILVQTFNDVWTLF